MLEGLSEKDAFRRLQALIAEWLRMENVVVLSGAGASVSEGGKTMADLEASVLEAVTKCANLPAEVHKLVQHRRDDLGHKRAVLGFEGWLSFIVNALHVVSAPGSPLSGVRWAGGCDPSPEAVDWFVQRASSAIFWECALRLSSDDGKAVAPHLSFLAKLVARDSSLGRAHLFTLNYDTLFEQALERLGIQYFDGFSGRAHSDFDPSVYGLDIYYPGDVAEGRVRRLDRFLHLYKLHGSIHWRNLKARVVAHHPDPNTLGRYSALAKPEEKAAFLDKTEPTPIAVLPTANKFAQTLDMPFSHMFRAFQGRLAVPQTFFLVLGYGFGDAHVNRVIETALTNPSLVLLAVDPCPDGAVVEWVANHRGAGKRAFVLTASAVSHAEHPFQKATFQDFGSFRE
ncbi:SIR2 family protein [Luteitalea sp.]|uniref:SIR2 family protein n=1 Tax=Luteitalea sp. TaxID=2004800 RepID=UPI0025BE687E|nr:SIR2 family protein [Luteitalea sp.]